MPVFFLLAVGLALVLVGIGVVVAVAAMAAAGLMIALGLTSSAILTGIVRRKLSSGLRAFHYPLWGLIGVPAGVAMLTIAVWAFEIDMRRWEMVAAGSLGGACAGLLLAFGIDLLARIIFRRLVEKDGGALCRIMEPPRRRG